LERDIRGRGDEIGRAYLCVLYGEAGLVLNQALNAVVAAIGGGEMERSPTL
jgi:hypothetical protein